MNSEDSYSLVKGSMYRVTSAGTADHRVVTEGEFVGYQQFGDETAMALRMSAGEMKGSVRIIPCSAVLYVDVLRQEKEPGRPKDKSEKMEFYG